MTLYPLVEPLSQSLNIENVHLDFNNLGPTFVQSLVEKLISNKRTDNVRASNLSDSKGAESSILTDETYSNAGTARRGNSESRTQGLISLSFEGNMQISDSGAASISALIST